MSDELVVFLRARLDEDEAAAEAASGREWGAIVPSQPFVIFDVDAYRKRKTQTTVGAVASVARAEDRAHIIRHDPARVLREVEAKRRVLARGGPFCTSMCDTPGNEPMDPATNWTVPLEHHYDCGSYEAAKLFAAVYADRPDYRQEWAP